MPIALLADDEDLPRKDLRELLAQIWPELTVVAECEDGLSTLRELTTHRPDVAFLDIRMPGMDGLQIARLAAARTYIVFVTAYDAHALTAFDAGALDYLTKPVSVERLAKAVGRLQARLAARTPPVDHSTLVTTLRPPAQRLQWISASVGTTIRLFAISDVLYFESDDKYTRVVAARDEAHVRTPLRQLMDGLDPDVFWQINRGLVVRASAIRRASRDELGRLSVQLDGRSEQLAVSRAYAHRFKPM